MGILEKRWLVNVLIAAVGLGLFAIVNARSGRIDVYDGLGWDGRQYSHMVTDRLVDGNVFTQGRPLIPLLTRIPYRAGLSVIAAFQVMNVLYAFVLYLSLCLILDVYRTPASLKLFFVANVALCIATSKMFAFYPALVDLGALAVITLAVYVALTGTLLQSALIAVLAVTAREFGLAVACFALHRRLRYGQPIATALAAYAPAVCAFFAILQWAATTNVGDPGINLLSTEIVLFRFLPTWRDPGVILFFAYFVVTLIGGVSLLLASRAKWCVRQLWEEPELATFSVIILGASVLAIDIGRYLVFLVPVIAILFGKYAANHRPGIPLLAAALILTFATQRPLARMDMAMYFRDWFPLYPYLRWSDPVPDFWRVWTIRLAVTGTGVIVLALIGRMAARNRVAHMTVRDAPPVHAGS